MEGKTHLTSGLLLWALGLGPEAVLGAMFPDVDCASATLGSAFVSSTYGHRGLFHSLSFLAIIGGMSVIAGRDGFALGYGAHLALDALTKGGVRLLAPFSKKSVRGPFKTGDFFDTLLSAVFLAIAVASLI